MSRSNSSPSSTYVGVSVVAHAVSAVVARFNHPGIAPTPTAKKCLQMILCSSRVAAMEPTSIIPGPAGLKALSHPGRLRMLGPAAHRGPGHRHHAGAAARPQQRRHVVPPAPAREARLHRRGHRARQRPRPVVAGRAPVHPDRRRRTRRRRRSTTPRGLPRRPSRCCYTEQLQHAVEEMRPLPPAVAGRRQPQRLDAAAHPGPGRGPGRGAARRHRELARGATTTPDAAPLRGQRQRLPAARHGGRRRRGRRP